MNASSPAMTVSGSGPTTHAFWERLWRQAGVGFIAFFIIAYAVYGTQPHIGASADVLRAFYDGNRVRILIAVVLAGPTILNLMWFAAAIRTALAEAGQSGWGTAATTASATLGGLFYVALIAVATLSCSIAGSGNEVLMTGLNDFAWTAVVMSSFPRAMLIMAGTFGLWRAGLISNALFAAGVAALVLVLLGGTTWLSDGFWAPDGAYSRFISPVIGLAWIVVVTRVLSARSPATRAGW